MRRVSALFLLACASLLLGQAPIGIGPTILDTFTWRSAVASGCTTGTRQMCVGENTPVGDTPYFTGWFKDASQLPVPTGLPIVGMLNDFNSKTCGGNVAVFQLAAFSWSNRNASKVAEVNCLSSFNSGQNAPAGWYGHCTSGDGSPGCVWHSRSPFVRGGKLYVTVMRQAPAGTPDTRDATFIMSADGGATWKNPYTVSQGGAARADGDAPLCDSAGYGATNPCTNANYAAYFMWRGVSGNLTHWQVVQYGQDWGSGSPSDTMPSGVNDGCDPLLYTCFIGDPLDRSLMRVLNPDLPLLDTTKYQYYTCPAITDTYRCPGSDPASWSSNYADRTEIGPPAKPLIWSNPVTYIKEFKSYLMIGGTTDGMIFLTAPTIQGPWTWVTKQTATGQGFGFTQVVMGVGYTVVSTNPPHVQVTLASDRTDLDTSHQGSYRFDLVDLVLGRSPGTGNDVNQYILPRSGVLNTLGAKLVYSDGHSIGTIPRKDLALGFDLYDCAGVTPCWIYGMRDFAGHGTMLLGQHGGLPGWNSGRGTNLTTTGIALADQGYGASFFTVKHEYPQTAAIGAPLTSTGGLTVENAPAAMQGNGTFTVAGVFQRTGGTYNWGSLWATGTTSNTASTMVGLSYPNGTGGPLELGWSLNDNRWRFNSGWTMALNSWYFIACTVQANGANPIAHMWVGENGLLADKLAGVSRTVTAGSPAQTPTVAAGPLILGMNYAGHHVSAGYAGLYVYSRALGQAELGLLYQTMKAEMNRRGIALQ